MRTVDHTSAKICPPIARIPMVQLSILGFALLMVIYKVLHKTARCMMIFWIRLSTLLHHVAFDLSHLSLRLILVM